MKILSHICILSIALLAGSCMAEDADMYEDSGRGGVPEVAGAVTDMESKPIEHLKVSVSVEGKDDIHVAYTSSEGMFLTQVDLAEGFETLVLNIAIEDIDAEENGGIFESKTDKIIIDRELYSEPIRVELSYRLNLATASESIPQS